MTLGKQQIETGASGPLPDKPFAPSRWPFRRWWILIALVFVFQVGAIYWLGDNSPIRPRPARTSPNLRFSGNGSSELLALTDPTLFALPHREAFSGGAWLKMPLVPTTSFAWSEPPRWLNAPTQELGASFLRVTEHYSFDPFESGAHPDPELTLPARAPGPPPAHSSFRVAGALAGRRLLTPFNLPDWTNNDLLTNTVLKLLVNAEGMPVSVAVLSGSGFKPADDFARDLARTFRFEALANSGPRRTSNPLFGLTIGELWFEWQTLAPPRTNAPPP